MNTQHIIKDLIRIGNNQAGALTTENGEVWHPANLLLPAAEHMKKLDEAADMLWTVVANVSNGNWEEQSEEWQTAARRWAENYHTLRTPNPNTEEVSAKSVGEKNGGKAA